MDANAPKQKEIYMKKLTFLPLFLVAPLLVGCGNNVKAPKFAKVGDEVAGDKFIADLTEKSSASAISKEDKLGSLVIKSVVKSVDEAKLTRADKTVVSQSTTYEEQKTDAKYDAANLLVAGKTSAKATLNKKTLYGTEKTNGTTKGNTFIQQFEKDGKKYAVMGNKEAKELNKMVEFTELLPADKYFDTMMKAMIGENGEHIMDACADWSMADEEGKKNFKFYENGNIFTVEYKRVIENEEHKNGEDKVDKVTNATYSYKAQIDLTDGAWKAMYYSEAEEKVEYKLNSGSNLEGEVKVTKGKSSEEVEVNSKDVKLKAVDVSKYKDNI